MKRRIMIGNADVTEHVAAMFDAIVGSLDWGSGFLSSEEIESIVAVGTLAGFDVPDVGVTSDMGQRLAGELAADRNRAIVAMTVATGRPCYERDLPMDERVRIQRDHDRRTAEAMEVWKRQIQAKFAAAEAEADEGLP